MASAGALAGIICTYAALRTAAPERNEPVREVVRTEAEVDAIARLVDALPFAAFTVDDRTRVRLFNDAASALFGVARGRALGRALIEVIPSVDLERMVEAAVAGETRTRDVAFGAGSRERMVGVTVRPFEAGAMAIAADRTAYLAAERVRRDFVANVSHELRTPLTTMKLMVETVLVDDDAEARSIFLPQVLAEVDRMVRLIEDLLELARSESGTLPLQYERFDLREVAESIVSILGQRAHALGVALGAEGPRAVLVDADRGRLTQVVTNLCDNALRHTPSGGSVTVTVASDGGDAVLAVKDTGTGIPFNDLSRVFERFYVVDRSRSRERAGTGLGLAIAKHLVEEHGGTLAVESVYGHGATFTMRIPRARRTDIKMP